MPGDKLLLLCTVQVLGDGGPADMIFVKKIQDRGDTNITHQSA